MTLRFHKLLRQQPECMRKSGILFLLVLFLTGCASLRLAKKAADYEQAGMYGQAVDFFIRSLQRKPQNNERATMGLMHSSLLLADELTKRIDDAYATYHDDAIVQSYAQLKNLQSSADKFGVSVDIPGRTLIQYEEARKRYQFSNYTEAQKLLDQERFNEAVVHLERILQVDPGYERTRELYDFARCEPMYRSAITQLNQGRHRSAWYLLEKVRAIDPGFKDVVGLQRESQLAGMLTIALKTYPEEVRRYPGLYRHIDGELKDRFHKLNHPFIQLVSEEYVQRMMEEQRRSLSENRPVDPIAMIPVRVQFVGSVIQYKQEDGFVRQTERKAWLKEMDRERKVNYKKVSYFEVEQSRLVHMTYTYEFVSVENARVLVAGKVSSTFRDAVQYASGSYDPDNLYPGDWGAGVKDTIYTDSKRRSDLRTLLSARREMKRPSDFEEEFSERVAADVIKKINAYDPER